MQTNDLLLTPETAIKYKPRVYFLLLLPTALC